MKVAIENDVFAGALGLWLGYLLTISQTIKDITSLYYYIGAVFLVAVLLTIFLSTVLSIDSEKVSIRRYIYEMLLIGSTFIISLALHDVKNEASIDSVSDLQINLVGAIIFCWVIAVEFGFILKKQTSRNN
jgi:hypothetical protein